MIKKITFILLVILPGFAFGQRKPAAPSRESLIITAFEAKNYEKVLTLMEQLENDKNPSEISHEINELAGKSAFYTESWDKVHIYLTRIADVNSNPEILGMIGMAYFYWGDKDLEYRHWNRYLQQLLGSSFGNTASTRLFVFNIENGNINRAMEVWGLIPEKDNPELQFEYLKLLDKSGQKQQAFNFNSEIIQTYPDHENALYWRGRFYFDKAEEAYQNEMKKYNRNPDHTSYAYLRRELKVISVDFRTSRDIFLKLHEINPGSINYIQNLKNCYLRLEMKEEADRMEQLIINLKK